MNVLQARTFFERLAIERGLKLAGISSAGENRDWVSRAFRDNAEIRVTWRAASETIKLEISHGPEAGSTEGWLMLFSETCSNGIVPAKQEAEGYESAVAYGLDLMGENRGTRGA